MTTRTARPAHATSWRNAVFATFALNGIGAMTWAIRIPAIRDHLELSTSVVGLLILSVSVGSIVGLLFASHLMHWLGDRRVIGITLGMCAVALAGIGIGTSVLGSFGVVVVAMAVYGFGTAVCDVAMNVEGAGVEKAIGRTMLPLFHASWSAGSVVGTGIGTAAAFAGVDPAIHLTVMAVVLGAGAIVVPRFIPPAATHDESGQAVVRLSFRERMAIWLEPRTLLLGVIVLGMAFTEGSANDWIALAMVDDRGFDNGQGAATFTLFTVAMTIGRLAGGPLVDRYGRVRLLWATGASAAIGLAIVIFVPIVPLLLAGVVLWGLGASLGFPLAMSAAADDPARAAARVSAVATIGYSAFLIGPPLIGFVGEHIGLLNALLIVFVLIVVATIAAPAARPVGSGSRAPATAEPPASEQMR
ncbi:MFS transporter [Homoserinibacter sp. GY 40078]|uniref:MFS transporter n=1 Tax=Homoserinibacter sp. GY 40078 TaxID=2603275 RepID=UPI0011CA2A28|nr:MFS transporter [Homoserinibacter sp. GY 40078]TXK18835.1 MFS transporter [Homoserinibacter sp. GY 40078]